MKKQAAAEAAACFGLLMDADDAVVLTQTRVAVGNEGFAVPLDENDDHIRQADVRQPLPEPFVTAVDLLLGQLDQIARLAFGGAENQRVVFEHRGVAFGNHCAPRRAE